MILEPKTSALQLLPTWSAGIALLCLGVGLHGAVSPLIPTVMVVDPAADEPVMVEVFQPPAAADSAADDAPEPPQEEEQDLEMPPLPEMATPLTPPEMVDITPVEAPPPPAPVPMPKPAEKKPEPPKPAAKPTPRSPTKTSGGGSATGSTSSSPTLFKGGGAGRFPSPSYPASARSAKRQGSVRLLVTVEASGVPSSVEISQSSGFQALDSAARDTVRRRWRWPSGAVRKFIVPIRFQLQ